MGFGDNQDIKDLTAALSDATTEFALLQMGKTNPERAEQIITKARSLAANVRSQGKQKRLTKMESEILSKPSVQALSWDNRHLKPKIDAFVRSVLTGE